MIEYRWCRKSFDLSVINTRIDLAPFQPPFWMKYTIIANASGKCFYLLTADSLMLENSLKRLLCILSLEKPRAKIDGRMAFAQHTNQVLFSNVCVALCGGY
jgi:hypothetical protein